MSSEVSGDYGHSSSGPPPPMGEGGGDDGDQEYDEQDEEGGDLSEVRMGGTGSGRRVLKDNEWACTDAKCSAINYNYRKTCSKCGRTKPKVKGKVGVAIGKDLAEKSKGLFAAEDWACTKCGNINWARRSQCNICNAPKLGEQEARTGYGGGYMDRQEVEYIRRDDSDDEFDEFGRRRKKANAPLQSMGTAVQKDDKLEEKENETTEPPKIEKQHDPLKKPEPMVERMEIDKEHPVLPSAVLNQGLSITEEISMEQDHVAKESIEESIEESFQESIANPIPEAAENEEEDEEEDDDEDDLSKYDLTGFGDSDDEKNTPTIVPTTTTMEAPVTAADNGITTTNGTEPRAPSPASSDCTCSCSGGSCSCSPFSDRSRSRTPPPVPKDKDRERRDRDNREKEQKEREHHQRGGRGDHRHHHSHRGHQHHRRSKSPPAKRRSRSRSAERSRHTRR